MGKAHTLLREPTPAPDLAPPAAAFEPAQDRMPARDDAIAGATRDVGVGQNAQRDAAGADAGDGLQRDFSRVPVGTGAPAGGAKAAQKKSSRGGFLQALGSFFGDLFSKPGAAITRLFGGEGYGDKELQAYLDRLDKLKDIEGDYDSDNKARAVIKRWKAGKAKFELSGQQKMLLIRELQSGATIGGDEQAILDLLKRSEDGDLRIIFGAIKVDDLLSDFSGANAKQLRAWLESHFEGGADALRVDDIKPQGGLPKDAPLFPYDWARFRLKFEGSYRAQEIIEELARHPLAERERAARDLAKEHATLTRQIQDLSERMRKAGDKAAQDDIQAQISVLALKRLRMNVVMEEAFKDIVLAETPAELGGKTTALTPDQKQAARDALKPEVKTTTGGVPLTFKDTLPGETKNYEQKLRELTPGMIDAYWNKMAKERQPSDHSDPAKMHTLQEMEGLAKVSKDETDDVFGGYYNKSAHPAMKADRPGRRGSLHDLWKDTQDFLNDPSTRFATKRELARALMFYFFTNNRELVLPLNREHNASPDFDRDRKPRNAEARAQQKIAEEFTRTPVQVRKLNEIDRGWDASANPETRDVNIQLFKPKGGVPEDQDFMWDMFQTLIHEYLHTVVHPRYRTFANSFGFGSLQHSTLIEGMDSFLDEVVWANVQPRVNDLDLRKKVEGPAYAALPPIAVRHPSRRRYPSFTEAVKLVTIVGFRNVVVAYFKGEIDKIGA
jgi:hypothetical protein